MMHDQTVFEKFKWRVLSPMAAWLLQKTVRLWANHFLDQFEKFKFQCKYGHTVYFTLSFYDQYPDSFEDLDHPDQPYAPPPKVDTMGPL